MKWSYDSRVRLAFSRSGHWPMTELILCKCGCGEYINSKIKGVEFIYNHHTKLLVGDSNPSRRLAVRRKISRALMGHSCSEETKKKLSESHHDVSGSNNPMYGKTHSKKAKKIISEAQRQREHHPYPEELKLRWSNTRKLWWSDPENRKKNSGRNSWGWKGGLSFEPYSYEFDRSTKESIKRRDRYMCQNPNCCRVRYGLVVHHINYDKRDNRRRNLLTLCAACNSRANWNRDYWRTFYEDIVYRRLAPSFPKTAESYGCQLL